MGRLGARRRSRRRLHRVVERGGMVRKCWGGVSGTVKQVHLFVYDVKREGRGRRSVLRCVVWCGG